MSTRNLQRLETGETKTIDASTLLSIAGALEADISELFEHASVHVDTIHQNNGIVGSGNLTLNNSNEDFLKCLENFAQQQRLLFESFADLVKNLSKGK